MANDEKQLDHPFERLKARAEAAKQRSKNTDNEAPKKDEAGSRDPESLIERVIADSIEENRRKAGGLSPRQIKHIDDEFTKGDQMGLFNSYPLQPRDEVPTLLCRLPIFLPISRKAQTKFLDKDLAFEIDTPFGKGRRMGPPLTTRDEDTLFALLRLRTKGIQGQCRHLPIPISEIYKDVSDSKSVSVHTVTCTVSQINNELGLTDGGKNFKETLDSVRRLAGAVIEISVNKQERYFHNLTAGQNFKLVDVKWMAWEEHGVITCQFTPVVVQWLEREFTYLNWEVRKKLKGKSARAIHRFLSTQKKQYKRGLNEIAHYIGLNIPTNKMKTTFNDACKQLVDLGWLEDFTIHGTGRKTPFVLEITR